MRVNFEKGKSLTHFFGQVVLIKLVGRRKFCNDEEKVQDPSNFGIEKELADICSKSTAL